MSSLIFCDKCGARYSANHGYYKCYSRSKSDRKYIVDKDCKNKNWNIEKLDGIIINEIEKLKHDNQHIDKIFASKKDENPVNKKSLNERIKVIDLQISKLIDLYQVKDIAIDEISSRINALQKEKDTLNEIVINHVEDVRETKYKFITLLSEFDDILKCGSLEEKRLFVSSLIKSIIINDEQININWRI